MMTPDDKSCARCEGRFDENRLEKGLCPMCREIDVWIRRGEFFTRPPGAENADAC
jgi:Zn finger protein HypA/HybF involved in hydrogenase expression